MSDWTSGYVSEIDYTYGYYLELNPLRAQFALTGSGQLSPTIETACELGFGQGLSANIHAAASATQWYGTDFNPSQAGFAQSLGSITGLSAYDEAFADFCHRSDLPDFDFIGLHGIWSWVSDENRRIITEFVRKKLKVGGVLYISYNTLPGWSTAAPIRHLLVQHAETLGVSGGGIVKQIDAAIEYTDKLIAVNPIWARANPSVAERLNLIKPQNRNYLAHEYFNLDWRPMYFSDAAKLLEPAKINFANSANYIDFIDMLNLTAEQQTLLNETADPNFRQTIRDFMVNQQFRKDYWVKGPRRLNVSEKADAIRKNSVVLIMPREDISMKAKGVLGEANLAETIYNPLLDALADYQVKTVEELEKVLSPKGVNLGQILQAVLVLIGQGHLAPANDPSTIKQAKHKSHALNRLLLEKAKGSADISYLASPVTGGGIVVGRFNQLFLLSLQQGKKSPMDWAKDVWATISGQGQRLVKEGKTIETADENIAELVKQAEAFSKKQLPILKALQVI